MMTLNFHATRKIKAEAISGGETTWIKLILTDYNDDENEITIFCEHADDAEVYAAAINSAMAANLARREDAAFEAAKHSDPCTEEAIKHGCSCSVPCARSTDIDPPEPRIDRNCPLHGNAPDPDAAYDAARDDAMERRVLLSLD